MTHDELLKEIDRYLVPTLAESEVGNKAIGILKALRAVVELHTPATKNSFTNNDCICMLPNKKCATIQAIEKELQ